MSDIFGMPAFFKPWISRFFTLLEIELLTSLNETPMAANGLRQVLGKDSSDNFCRSDCRFLHQLARDLEAKKIRGSMLEAYYP